jgi:hypothetical protein
VNRVEISSLKIITALFNVSLNFTLHFYPFDFPSYAHMESRVGLIKYLSVGGCNNH